ncbi:Bug family tripartite tricarboxylate transporter substrate binding protein [Ramlibacter sp. PS4R-6]|uniref:Bug family tripartite tricarboxylate transporter substrate binding protein n=1 Tax=Ramlibacter sp. PS4R-6 TaxID=3133438 RepID=UPI0030B4958B
MLIHPPIRRRAFIAALCASSVLPAAKAARPLRLIVPAPAGGTTDFVARKLADVLQRTAGLQAVIENLPGVGGTVATDALLAAPADGSVFLLSPDSLVTEVPYTVKPRYDPFADIVPLAQVASTGLVLVASASVGVQSVPDMVRYVKAQPAPVPIASFGAGTASHVKVLQLAKAAGADLLHVGYRGSPPALLDVIAGRVPFMFDGIATSLPHIRGGALKALAVTSAAPAEVLPGVPTLAELGYGELTQAVGITLFTTPSNPAGIVADLRARVLAALSDPTWWPLSRRPACRPHRRARASRSFAKPFAGTMNAPAGCYAPSGTNPSHSSKLEVTVPRSNSKGLFAVSVSYGPSMVLIACSGPATVLEICGALTFGAEVSRRSMRPLFLFDLLAVDFDGTDADRVEMGHVAAGLLHAVDRIAVVLKEEQNTHLGERQAQQEGLRIRNFENLPDAIEWLSSANT